MQQTSPQTPVSPPAGADLSTALIVDVASRDLAGRSEGGTFVRQVAAASYRA